MKTGYLTRGDTGFSFLGGLRLPSVIGDADKYLTLCPMDKGLVCILEIYGFRHACKRHAFPDRANVGACMNSQVSSI